MGRLSEWNEENWLLRLETKNGEREDTHFFRKMIQKYDFCG